MKDMSVEKILRYRSFSHMLKSWKIIGPVSGLENDPADSCLRFEAENSETEQKSMLCFQAFPLELAQCAPEGSEADRRYAVLYHEAIEQARNQFMDCEYFECEFRHKGGYECVQRIVISIWPLREEKDFIVRTPFVLKQEPQAERQAGIEQKERASQEAVSHAQISAQKKEDVSQPAIKPEERAAEIREEQAAAVFVPAEKPENKPEDKPEEKAEKKGYGGVNRLLALACVCLLILVVLLIAAYIRKDRQIQPQVSATKEPAVSTTQGPTSVPVVISEETQTVKPEETQEAKPEATQTVKPDKAQAVKPEATQAVKPEETQAVKPEATQAVKSDKAQAVKPEETQAVKPDKAQAVKPEQTQSAKPKETSVPAGAQADKHEPQTTEYDEQLKAKIRIGDLYMLGAYEQNNEKKNGSEEIEWIVLAKDDEGLLLISRYVLDCIPYSQSKQSVNWKNSFLRSWMNGTFYEKAFSEEEKNSILLRTQDNPSNPQYGTPGCEATSDRIFALSEQEAKQYLTDENRNTVGTAYARAQGAKFRKESGSKQVYWWLRTPGKNNQMAMITSVGKNALDYVGNSVGEKFSDGRKNNTGVRPALWLSWAHVEANEGQQDAVESAAKEKKEPVAKLIKQSVGLREKPDGKAKRIVVTQMGDEVRLLGWLDNEQGRWYQVEYKGHTGYLNSTMLEVRDAQDLPQL